MYRLCFALPTDDGRVLHAAVDGLVRALYATNVAWLATHPGQAPPLYASGVSYRPDASATELQWWPVPVVLAEGYADCKALAAWRAAEITVGGSYAVPVVRQAFDGRTWLQHVVIAAPWGEEDPSRVLGMKG